MSARQFTHTGIMAALLFCSGCVTDLTPSSSVPSSMPAGFVTHDQARDLAFTYRQRAAATSELARRIELEAAVCSRQLGPTHEESTRRLAQVKQLWAAAEEAEQLTRKVPHGQVQ